MSTSPNHWTKRYSAAHRKYQGGKYPVTVASQGATLTQYPQVTASNGLTQAIIKYLTWEGHRATRIKTEGRMIVEKYKGRIVSHGYIPTTTRKGTADISATIRGRSVMIEIKIGKDIPSDQQLAEQARERAAGGVYEFIKTIQEFFEFYDKFVSSIQ